VCVSLFIREIIEQLPHARILRALGGALVEASNLHLVGGRLPADDLKPQRSH
jgi:hypothetical protein